MSAALWLALRGPVVVGSLSPDGCSGTLAGVLNPLRSEDEAFRLLLRVIGFFVVIVALIVIVRAVA